MPVSELGLLCLLALEAPAALDPAAVLAALTTTAPRSGIAIESRTGADGAQGLFVTIDRQEFAAAPQDCPIPEPVLGEALERGVFWRTRRAALSGHRAMIAISAAEPATGHGLLRAQAVALTRLAAAIAETVPAVALCWPSAATVAPPARLAQVIGEMQIGRWPVDIWIGYTPLRLRQGEGQTLAGARSRGALGYFGAEIEVCPIPATDMAEPVKSLVRATAQLMAHGTHLRPGQPLRLPGGQVMSVERVPARGGDPPLIRLGPASADEAGRG